MPIRLRSTGALLLDDVSHFRFRPPVAGALVAGQAESQATPAFDAAFRFADGTAEIRCRLLDLSGEGFTASDELALALVNALQERRTTQPMKPIGIAPEALRHWGVTQGLSSLYPLRTPEGRFDMEQCFVLMKGPPTQAIVLTLPYAMAAYDFESWQALTGRFLAELQWPSQASAVEPVQPSGEAQLDMAAIMAAPREPGLAPARLQAAPGTDPSPLLVFMESPMVVNMIAAASSLPSYWAPTLGHVLQALAGNRFCGLLAQSPLKSSGAAYEVIERFRAASSGLVIYNSWDYRMEIAAGRALRARADLLLIGGSAPHEMMSFILSGLELKQKGIPPPSAAFYEAYLRATMPGGNAWQMADMQRRKAMPPSATE